MQVILWDENHIFAPRTFTVPALAPGDVHRRTLVLEPGTWPDFRQEPERHWGWRFGQLDARFRTSLAPTVWVFDPQQDQVPCP